MIKTLALTPKEAGYLREAVDHINHFSPSYGQELDRFAFQEEMEMGEEELKILYEKLCIVDDATTTEKVQEQDKVPLKVAIAIAQQCRRKLAGPLAWLDDQIKQMQVKQEE